MQAISRLRSGLIAAATLAFGATAVAQSAGDYPNKPMRFIIPQSPGSASDVLARIVAPRLGDALGQPIVIDNRAGAGGILGAEAGAKAAPDGYVVVLGASAWITIAPHTYKKLPYDPLTDLVPVSLFALSQNMLAVHPSLPANNVKELLELMKAKPDALNMASAGVGSSSHLAGLLFTSLGGVSAVHVPYKGAGQSVVAVIAGEAQWTFTPMQGPLPHVRAGKLRALAVGGSARSPILPDVPTAAEAGLPDYYAASWYGIMVPKGTPAPIVDKLNAAAQTALRSQELRDQIVFQGAEPKASTPGEFARLVQDEFVRAEARRRQGRVAGASVR
jgi:tripartite-type tricarboxylate transporter receptor subunit TctC